MKYSVSLNFREFEIKTENFSFDKYYQGLYDSKTKLGLTREAWLENIPLYLHDIGKLSPDYLIEKAQGIVTPEPVFSIFDKENLTFTEMLQEIWKRRKEIVRVTKGDDNPYE